MPTSTVLRPLLTRLQADLARATSTAAAIARVAESLEPTTAETPARLRTLIATVAEAHGLAPSAIGARSRQQPLVDARHMAAFLALELLPGTTPHQLAPALHLAPTSVRYAVRSVRDRLQVDAAYAQQLEQVADKCRAALDL